MELKSLTATFGRLKNASLPLSPGLNVIEAANESGKSTWMAFVKVMLYGLNTRDRSSLADKHRYMPWDGGSMQGSMDLSIGGREITVTRSTARSGVPMGSFSACYTGTSEPVPGLSAQTLGDTLTGVPQDVFERSAFIRQSGISIDQSPALEQRITSLITTGTEDTSFAEASDHLRRQIHRRRYHKAGMLPQLDSEIAALEDTLSEITSLENAHRSRDHELDELKKQSEYLQHQLSLCAAAEGAHRLSRLQEARDALAAAKTLRDTAALRVSSLPRKEELSSLAADLTAAEAMTAPAELAAKRMQDCIAAQAEAARQLSAHPFSPLSPGRAAEERAPEFPSVHFPVVSSVISAVFCILLFVVLHIILHLPLSLSLGAVLLCSGILLVTVGLCTAHRQKRRILIANQRQQEFHEELSAYTILYEAAEQAQAAAREAEQAYRDLSSSYRQNLEHSLSLVQTFGSTGSIEDAHRSIRHALALHAACQEADHQYRQAQLRVDLLAETAPQDVSLSDEAPELTQADAESRLSTVTAALEELHRQCAALQGKISALGDAAALRAELGRKHTARSVMQAEYDALSLALEVMQDANAVLQTRFSPALGEKSANIFTKLTKGKYNKVLLDRKMTPSAREESAPLPHAVTSLSQGAADQLYLAVRLAVCDMVLPQESHVPIFLDDALVTFDDDRMAAALDYLVELSEKRQILLFTCQKRELTYLRAAHPGKYSVIPLS